MSSRPLPKRLRHACAVTYADRVHEGWTEQDDWNGFGTWSHWVYLKPGWRNAWVDPCAALHAIHEPEVKEVLLQLRKAEPCDCEECQRCLDPTNTLVREGGEEAR